MNMRVLVAGGTGALGVPVVRQLLAQGHEVIGLSRSTARQEQIRRLGAEVVTADALDPAALQARVMASAPEAVIHALTAIPAHGPLRAADVVRTNALRDIGTRNLLAAAIAAGAKRFIAESMIFLYGFGDLGPEPLTEEQPAAQAVPHPWLRPSVQALASEERQVIAASRSGQIEGVLLRFGGFYGPSAGTATLVRLLKRRLLPLPRGAKSLTCWIHVEDAAAAMVAALTRGRSGQAYNIVDDEPVPFADFLRYLARAADTPAPWLAPRWLMDVATPFLTASWMGSLMRVSNQKAKAELGWTPRFPTYREGLTSVLEDLARDGTINTVSQRDRVDASRSSS
jgi:nucleoside-diphosphate-sugar epimerase